MDAFCGAGSDLGDGGLTGGNVLGFMKRRLCQNVCLSSVCTQYDLGVLLGVMTLAGVHLSHLESWAWSLSPGCNGGSWCAVRSWYIFCLVCACCLLVMTSVELTIVGRRCLAADGRMDHSCLPIPLGLCHTPAGPSGDCCL